MQTNKEFIIWVDVETSGLDARYDSLLEIAAICTDMCGNRLGAPFHSLCKQANLSQVIQSAEDEARKLHEVNHLWQDLYNEKTPVNFEQLDKELLFWMYSIVPAKSTIYFGGNSPSLDRNFLAENLPLFYSEFSHRSVDVTSISLFFKHNSNRKNFFKTTLHRSLSDIQDSVEEYRFYADYIDEARESQK